MNATRARARALRMATSFSVGRNRNRGTPDAARTILSRSSLLFARKATTTAAVPKLVRFAWSAVPTSFGRISFPDARHCPFAPPSSLFFLSSFHQRPRIHGIERLGQEKSRRFEKPRSKIASASRRDGVLPRNSGIAVVVVHTFAVYSLSRSFVGLDPRIYTAYTAR